jgi:hypothetical protein
MTLNKSPHNATVLGENPKAETVKSGNSVRGWAVEKPYGPVTGESSKG